MQIMIDTDQLSELDRKVFAVLAGLSEEPLETETVQAAPAKTAPVAKAPAKKPEPEPEPEPEEEPEPMAEEPLPEEEEADDEPETDEEVSDEDLLTLAVKKATEMVSSGGAAEVRAALNAAGASRVRELNKDNVREFFKALDS